MKNSKKAHKTRIMSLAVAVFAAVCMLLNVTHAKAEEFSMPLSQFVYNEAAKTITGYVITENPENATLSVIYEDGTKDNFPEPDDILYIGDRDGKKCYRVSFSKTIARTPSGVTVKDANDEINYTLEQKDGNIVFGNTETVPLTTMTDPVPEQTTPEPDPVIPLTGDGYRIVGAIILAGLVILAGVAAAVGKKEQKA